ncbi:MAG: hypothetical protein V4525_08080 [Pseudomonadota bacterium]
MKHALIFVCFWIFLSENLCAQTLPGQPSKLKGKITRCDYPENAQLYDIITKKKTEFASVEGNSEQAQARKATLNREIQNANEKLKCTTE